MSTLPIIIIIIIIIIKNECHSNIIVDRLQGCSHSKKLRESESELCSSKVVWQVRTLKQFSFQVTYAPSEYGPFYLYLYTYRQ